MCERCWGASGWPQVHGDGRASPSRLVISGVGSSISALIWDSFMPAIRLILQKNKQNICKTILPQFHLNFKEIRKMFYLYVTFQSLEFTVLSEYIIIVKLSQKANTFWYVNVPVSIWTDRRTEYLDGWMNGWMNAYFIWIDRWMDGWGICIDGWSIWMDGQMDV